MQLSEVVNVDENAFMAGIQLAIGKPSEAALQAGDVPLSEAEPDMYPCLLALCGSGFGFFQVTIYFRPRHGRYQQCNWASTHAYSHHNTVILTASCLVNLSYPVVPWLIVSFFIVPNTVPGNLAYSPTGTGSPNFNCNNFKFAQITLKFSVCAHIASGLVGVSSRIFSGRRTAGRCANVNTIFGMFAPYILGGQKTSKFLRYIAYIWQLSTLIANISRTDRHIENRKSSWSTTTPPTFGDKKLVNKVHIDPPKRTFFGTQYLGP